MRTLPWLCAVLIILSHAVSTYAAGLPEPSKNQHREGTYQVNTGWKNINYHIYVPSSYNKDNAAGLHVFFHGQNGQKGAANFNQWRPFLESHNMIGLNMQYMDGDNAKDTGTKVKAAATAIAQTLADYHILRGKGAIGSFSGGGLPHAGLHAKYAKTRAYNDTWPFCHVSLYGSNYHKSPKGAIPMSWFVGLGAKEWGMGLPTLGNSQTGRFEDLLEDKRRIGPNMMFHLSPEKGHSISREDVRISARQFGYSYLAYSELFAESRWQDNKSLLSTIKLANKGKYSSAYKKIEGLLKKGDPDQKADLELILARINQRADAIVKAATTMSENDPLLLTAYQKNFAGKLKGLAQEKAFTTLYAEFKKSKKGRDDAKAFEFLGKYFEKFYAGSAVLKADAKKALGALEPKVTPDSLIGMMITTHAALPAKKK